MSAQVSAYRRREVETPRRRAIMPSKTSERKAALKTARNQPVTIPSQAPQTSSGLTSARKATSAAGR